MGTIEVVQNGDNYPLIFAAWTFRSISNSCGFFLPSFCVTVFNIR
jgi:hypothetical protein